jgi:sensor domain CHASE-containing protein
MKKLVVSILSLYILSVITVSCNTNTSAQENDQPVIDSIVHEKVQKIHDQLEAQCDSTIMQMARVKADSILKSKKK